MAKIKIQTVTVLSNHSQIINNIKTSVLTEQIEEEIFEVSHTVATNFKYWARKKGVVDMDKEKLSEGNYIYVSLEAYNGEGIVTIKLQTDKDSAKDYIKYVIEFCGTNPSFREITHFAGGFLAPKPYKVTVDDISKYYSYDEYSLIRRGIIKLIDEDKNDTESEMFFPGNRKAFYLEHTYEGVTETFYLNNLDSVFPTIRAELDDIDFFLENTNQRNRQRNGR